MTEATRRKRGEGSVREKRPGVWAIAYDIPTGEDGRRRQRYATVKGTERQARDRLRQLMGDVANGKHAAASGETVAHVVEQEWLPRLAEKVRPQTRDWYLRLYRQHIAVTLGKLKVKSVQAHHVRRVLERCEQHGLSANSRRRVHTAMHSLFGAAVKAELISVNPVDKVDAPSPERHRMDLPTPAQVSAILHEVAAEPNALAYTLLVHTGARRAEVAGLRWRDVDFAENRITIAGAIVRLSGKGLIYSPPKTQRSNRTIDVDPAVMEQLRQHRLQQMKRVHDYQGAVEDSGFVFTSEDGGMVDPDTFTKAWGKAARRCGVKARLHDLRHFALTHLLANGIEVHVVQAIAGHSSPLVTLGTYAHVLNPQARKAAAVMGKVMEGAGSS